MGERLLGRLAVNERLAGPDGSTATYRREQSYQAGVHSLDSPTVLASITLALDDITIAGCAESSIFADGSMLSIFDHCLLVNNEDFCTLCATC